MLMSGYMTLEASNMSKAVLLDSPDFEFVNICDLK